MDNQTMQNKAAYKLGKYRDLFDNTVEEAKKRIYGGKIMQWGQELRSLGVTQTGGATVDELIAEVTGKLDSLKTARDDIGTKLDELSNNHATGVNGISNQASSLESWSNDTIEALNVINGRIDELGNGNITSIAKIDEISSTLANSINDLNEKFSSLLRGLGAVTIESLERKYMETWRIITRYNNVDNITEEGEERLQEKKSEFEVVRNELKQLMENKGNSFTEKYENDLKERATISLNTEQANVSGAAAS